ncbi:MAG: hypothetical protein ACFB50_05540 [Rubrobacteraceae bacterium]
MDSLANHVVVVGGPELEDELLAIVLDDGEAIPVFESVGEAEEFLDSTGDFGRNWRAREVSAEDLLALLEYQGDEVEHVALSPPPERLEGGMEVQVIPRHAFTSLLERQLQPEPPSEGKGFWRRFFHR